MSAIVFKGQTFATLQELTFWMLEHPVSWPKWVLPMKRSHPGSGAPELLTVAEDGPGKPLVCWYECMFAIDRTTPAVRRTPAELIAAGWIVD